MELPERIVCAANKAHGTIILGLRHNDEFMRDAVYAMFAGKTEGERSKLLHDFLDTKAQGFVTNKRRWVSREEAYEIASNQHQVLRKTGGMGSTVLYSEDVY